MNKNSSNQTSQKSQKSNDLEYSTGEKQEDNDIKMNIDIGFNNSKRHPRNKPQQSFSKKEEDKMLKYALKMSEIEYKTIQNTMNNINSIKNYPDIPLSSTFEADEIDFMEFSRYIDSCWSTEGPDTGVIKIIPPKDWVENYKTGYYQVITEYLLKDTSKKHFYRIQKLKELCNAEAFEHTKDIIFDNFLKYGELYFNSIAKTLFESKYASTKKEESKGINEVDGDQNIEKERKIIEYIESDKFKDDMEEKYWSFVKGGEESKF